MENLEKPERIELDKLVGAIADNLELLKINRRSITRSYCNSPFLEENLLVQGEATFRRILAVAVDLDELLSNNPDKFSAMEEQSIEAISETILATLKYLATEPKKWWLPWSKPPAKLALIFTAHYLLERLIADKDYFPQFAPGHIRPVIRNILGVEKIKVSGTFK